MLKKAIAKIDDLIQKIDKLSLWWLGIVLMLITFLPYAILQEGSVFEIHDQLDESMLNYVLTARYLWQDAETFPEMLGGVNASGMQPAAILFVPLFALLKPFHAFIVMYGICFLCAFGGMYFCVKELTHSSIPAVVMAGCFAMLPLYPIYGLSEYGIPLVVYAFLCLWRQKKQVLSFVLLALWGTTSHLVCTGYAILGLWAIALLVMLLTRRRNKWLWIGFTELVVVFCIVNRSLLIELLFGNSAYISHRQEFVNYPMQFGQTFVDVFGNSAQHALSFHKYLIIPIFVLLVIGFFTNKGKEDKALYRISLWGMVFLVAVALFYAVCKSSLVVDVKNSLDGFLRYFQAERFYWLYPAAWYLEFAVAFAAVWKDRTPTLWRYVALAVILLPTMNLIKDNSFFYMNVNQINNGSGITGYITWEGYYAEDLMQELETTIGRDKDSYRVAHLGISPAPSLMHGFLTVDGYSNNYPLEYKHKFRKVIAKELEKNETVRLYFDEWGNRCYLFNSLSGIYWNIKKGSDVVYENLEFDMEALRELGCEYIFAGGKITDAKSMGLIDMGYHETEKSNWGIWLYKLRE